MSALVILECNACGAITPPWPTADKAREEAGPDGWAVDVDGSNIDYCPQCTAPASRAGFMPTHPSVGVHRGIPARLTIAVAGIVQLRDALASIQFARDVTPTAMASVANLARVRADQLLEELAS